MGEEGSREDGLELEDSEREWEGEERGWEGKEGYSLISLQKA